MHIIFSNKLKGVVLALLMLSIFSCSKDDTNLNTLNETIFVRHKKADMPAYIHGNGSEKVFLIILHGGPGGNGLFYRVNTIRTEIEKNNAIVYFDQRGHHNAQGTFSKDEINIDVMAEDVLALAKVIKAKYGDDSKLFLMGHSWGGTLGSATLLKDQSVFSGWIDVAGAHDLKGLFEANKTTLNAIANQQIALENSVDYWKNTLDLVQNIGSINDLESSGKLNGASIEGETVLEADEVVNKLQADYGNSQPSDNLPKTLWNSNNVQKILVTEQGIFQNISFADRLSEITLPSIVLWGKYDLVVPTIFAQEAFDNLGSSEKEIFFFEKSAHNLMLNEPNLFADKVIKFINRYK